MMMQTIRTYSKKAPAALIGQMKSSNTEQGKALQGVVVELMAQKIVDYRHRVVLIRE